MVSELLVPSSQNSLNDGETSVEVDNKDLIHFRRRKQLNETTDSSKNPNLKNFSFTSPSNLIQFILSSAVTKREATFGQFISKNIDQLRCKSLLKYVSTARFILLKSTASMKSFTPIDSLSLLKVNIYSSGNSKAATNSAKTEKPIGANRVRGSQHVTPKQKAKNDRRH